MKLATVLLAAMVVLGACASSPASWPAGVDSTGTVWGDEYEGLLVDPAEPAFSSPSMLRVEGIDGETRTLRADAAGYGARVRVRSSASGDVGSLAWRGSGLVREIAVGTISPLVADGALVGDPRTGGDLRAPMSTRAQGLRMEASSSSWAAMTGAGVVLGAEQMRFALGGWQSRDDTTRVAFSSLEWCKRGNVLGVAYGTTMPAHSRHAASLYAARDDGVAFVSGEIAVSAERVRAVARVVAGERREWSAIAIAGAGPAGEERLVFTPRERWGAALERRDTWSWGASRSGISSLTRRDVASDIRRRRAFWDGMWRIDDDTRLELAARVTREEAGRAAMGTLAAAPLFQQSDDWRARVTLRSRHAAGNGWILANAYRLEWVQNRSGRPGNVATWTCALNAGALDTRLSASAHALHGDQIAYSAESAPLGAGEYTAVSGKGASMSAAAYLAVGPHARLGATWSKRPPGESRLWISLALRT